jgi:hypothetical protein
MVPKIRVKYRIKENIKYAIEQFTGKQYRCLKCNNVYYSDKKLFYHIRKCKLIKYENRHIKFPHINDSIKTILLYAEDIKDDLRQKFINNKK